MTTSRQKAVGSAAERAVAAALDGRRVGMDGGPVDVIVDGYLDVQVKCVKGLPSPGCGHRLPRGDAARRAVAVMRRHHPSGRRPQGRADHHLRPRRVRVVARSGGHDMNATHYPDPDDLRAPGTDDEPWTVPTDDHKQRWLIAAASPTRVWAHFKAQPGFLEEQRAALRDIPEPDPPADRRGWALAVLIVALVVVAIVWRR